jgi:hypothetical protein
MLSDERLRTAIAGCELRNGLHLEQVLDAEDCERIESSVRALIKSELNGAYERAAKECENVYEIYVDAINDKTAGPLVDECAARIRNLKEPT